MWMGKEGPEILFFLNFRQTATNRVKLVTKQVAENTIILSGLNNYYFLFHTLNQPCVGSFLSGVEPEYGIDIKMYQPCGTFSLLADFFLVTVFYG